MRKTRSLSTRLVITGEVADSEISRVLLAMVSGATVTVRCEPEVLRTGMPAAIMALTWRTPSLVSGENSATML